MMREIVRRRVACRGSLFKLLAVSIAAAASAVPAAAQVPPNEEWRTLPTEHFRVTFPARLETLGRSAADRAERAWNALEDAFVEPPSGTIDILLTDHADISNGFAQFSPSNRITVYARPPTDDLALGYFDDWLELVITHELAHVVHLDMTGTWVGKLARGVFGRVNAPWPFFPGTAVPRWVVEGLATWYESDLTHAGRVHGTFHEMVVRTAALEGRFEDIGQAAGLSPQWPGGTRQYAYGSLFFDYLLEKHGEERMAAFVEAVAGQWVPYRLDAAGKRAFGASLSSEWAAWADLARADAEALDARLGVTGPVSEPERLTDGARWGFHPKLSPDGETLVYVRADGRSDQQLVRAFPDGSGAGKLVRTNQLATFDFTPDGGIVFAQLDYTDQYRIRSDLYLTSVDGGGVRRLTDGARLDHPSSAPDGRWAVAVRQDEGASALARVDLGSGAVEDLVAPQAGVLWAFPEVSPDGRWIAATRWTEGANSDVVILAPDGRVVSEVTRDRAVDLAPDWSADGRWLVWSSDRSGIANVYGATVDPSSGSAGPPVLLTNVRTGAAFPTLSPDGRWLYFSGYHVDGWEVERVPFRPEGIGPVPAVADRFAGGAPAPRGMADGEVRGYSALRTLAPTYWEPLLREPVETAPVQTPDFSIPSRQVLGYGIGVQTSGIDLVGRHSYAALARTFTSGGRAEGGFSYSYHGLGNPTLSVRAGQGWDDDGPRIARRTAGAPFDTLFVLERDRNVAGSVTFTHPTWRRVAALTLSGGLVWQHRELLDNFLEPSTVFQLNRPDATLSDFSASVSLSTARSNSFQLGADRGASVFLRARRVTERSLPDSLVGEAGTDRSADDLIGQVRAFLPLGGPGFASHVFALRGSFGVARGPNADASYFDVGGAAGSGEEITGLELFGGSPVFLPVRGYGRSSRTGRYAWSASAEYRVPLLLLNRGLGAWPLHVDRVFASAFFDAGNAWGPDRSPDGVPNPRGEAIASVGGELATEVLTFYKVSMLFRFGVAVPLVAADGARTYLRLGLPF